MEEAGAGTAGAAGIAVEVGFGAGRGHRAQAAAWIVSSGAMRYCEGLPETGERPLCADERAAVARLRRGLAWRIAAPLALGIAAPIAAIAAVAVAYGVLGAGSSAAALRVGAAVAFVAGILLGPAVALLWAHDRFREWRRVRRDAAAAVAIQFGEGARTISVLPASGRILARNGRPSALRSRAHVGAAAPAPPAPPTYALPAEALANGDAREIASHGLVRRPLSPEERDELRGHARGLRRIPRSLWLLAVWWALAALGWSAGHGPRKRDIVVIVTLPLALGAWRLLRARALAARLEADAEEGWAIRATAGATSGEEALPASRAAWTAGGAPARWRLGAPR